jgi:hypothetical protein
MGTTEDTEATQRKCKTFGMFVPSITEPRSTDKPLPFLCVASVSSVVPINP